MAQWLVTKNPNQVHPHPHRQGVAKPPHDYLMLLFNGRESFTYIGIVNVSKNVAFK